MRILACTMLLFLLPSYANAQEKEQWQRMYTYEESSVDIDAANVVFGTDFTGRVKFRFLLSKPQTVPGNKDIKYKSVIQTMEFRCPERLYRVVSVERLDSKGNRVDEDKFEPPVEWKPVNRGSMIDRLFTPACELIYKKKSNP